MAMQIQGHCRDGLNSVNLDQKRRGASGTMTGHFLAMMQITMIMPVLLNGGPIAMI
ncbi:MAG: hypothetical protein OSB58_18620 [Alphaproteobacteria bacterium]|nr:hypothetical protein [Alphaproteobacteria bacterium]